MKKTAFLIFIVIAAACSSTNVKTADRPLYEVLTTQHDGGANIRFYEILTEEKEIKMLQGDENLRKKIGPNDINTSNFVILNMGEQATENASIKIKNVTETADKVIITVEDLNAKPYDPSIESSYPYTIVRINSKKTIVIQ